MTLQLRFASTAAAESALLSDKSYGTIAAADAAIASNSQQEREKAQKVGQTDANMPVLPLADLLWYSRPGDGEGSQQLYG